MASSDMVRGAAMTPCPPCSAADPSVCTCPAGTLLTPNQPDHSRLRPPDKQILGRSGAFSAGLLPLPAGLSALGFHAGEDSEWILGLARIGAGWRRCMLLERRAGRAGE